MRVSEGSRGDRNSKGVSKLLILIILPAGSSPLLSANKNNNLRVLPLGHAIPCDGVDGGGMAVFDLADF